MQIVARDDETFRGLSHYLLRTRQFLKRVGGAMSTGLDNLKHIVVLMMENRSFDHMLGALKQKYPKINGLTGDESNPDTNGATVNVQQKAQFQSQLDPDPDHHFPGVDLQIFGGAPLGPGRVANMQGFV